MYCFAEAKPVQRSPGLRTERLVTLGRVHFGEPYPVPSFLSIDDGQGVAIQNSDHRPGQRFRLNVSSEKKEGEQ